VPHLVNTTWTLFSVLVHSFTALSVRLSWMRPEVPLFVSPVVVINRDISPGMTRSMLPSLHSAVANNNPESPAAPAAGFRVIDCSISTEPSKIRNGR
jgi:hypothetical protein